jgi:hypothetical protein
MTVETFVVDAQGRNIITVDPTSDLDYSFDWTAWLTALGDTIKTVTYAVDTPATTHGATNTSMIATVFVAINNAAAGALIKVTCTIVTNSATPRTDTRHIYLKVKEK